MSQRRRKRCPHCGENLTLLSINEAAAFARVSRKTIYRWLKTGMLDYWELPSGILRICQDSLIALPQVRERLKARAEEAQRLRVGAAVTHPAVPRPAMPPSGRRVLGKGIAGARPGF